MRHPAFHVSAKLVGSVSSVTGFLRQRAPSISRSWRRCATVSTPWLFLTANPVQTRACQEDVPDLLYAHPFSPLRSYDRLDGNIRQAYPLPVFFSPLPNQG